MLKISEMAKLADTTRRTLIFYDEQGVFKPRVKSAAGYRYYDYNQLYDLMTILGLRHVGLTLDQIKGLQANDQQAGAELEQAQAKIADQIKTLQRVQTVIGHRLQRQAGEPAPRLYAPGLATLDAATFWCSRKAVDCTEKEVAELFAEFYHELDALALMDTTTSGYLTDLPVKTPEGYMDASFRILKAADEQAKRNYIPLIEKPAGQYVRVWVENSATGIDRGLKALKAYCQAHHLKTQDRLWQLNSGDKLVDNGATEFGWLEYAVEES